MNTLMDLLNGWGQRFITFAVPMLLQSSLLIGCLLGLDYVIRNKVRAVVRYGLLLLIPLKLLLPVSLSLPTGVGYWITPPELGPILQPSSLRSARHIRPSEPDPVPMATPRESSSFVSTKHIVRAALPSVPMHRIALTWQGLALLGWLLGVIMLTVLFCLRWRRVQGLLAQTEEAVPEEIAMLEQCCQQMGIKRFVRLKRTPVAFSPALCGLLRPTILLPTPLAEALCRPHLRAVLLHELAHLKRRDLWVNCLQTLLQIVYFYHPLLWWANASMRRVREQAVDEQVLVALGQEGESYSETLAQVAKYSLTRSALSLGLVGIVESNGTLLNRIRHILNHPLPTTARLGAAAMVIIILVGAVLLPMTQSDKTKMQAAATSKPTGTTVETTPAMENVLAKTVQTVSPALSEKTLPQLFALFQYDDSDILRNETWSNDAIIQAMISKGPNAIRFLAGVLESYQTLDRKRSYLECKKALYMIRQIGPSAKAAIPSVTKLIRYSHAHLSGIELAGHFHNPVADLTHGAMHTLLAMGPEAKTALPTILAMVKGGCYELCDGMSRLDPNSKVVIDTLWEAYSTVKQGKADWLQDNDHDALPYIVQALSNIPSQTEAMIPTLVEIMQSSDWTAIHRSAPILYRIIQQGRTKYPEAEKVLTAYGASQIPQYVEVLQGKRKGMPKPGASMALRQMLQYTGNKPESAVQALQTYQASTQEPQDPFKPVTVENVSEIITLLKSASPNKYAAVDRLLSLTNEPLKDAIAPEVVPALIEALKDPQSLSRMMIVNLLGDFGARSKDAVPALIEVAKSDDKAVSGNAISALGWIGPVAKPALPFLLHQANDNRSPVQNRCASVLWRIDPQYSHQSVAAYIKNISIPEKPFGNEQIYVTARFLGEMPVPAKEAIPALQKLLSYRDQLVRLEAAFSLWKIDPQQAAITVRTLIELIETNQSRWSYPIKRLGQMGPAAKAAIPLLDRQLRSDDPNISNAAAEALQKIRAPR